MLQQFQAAMQMINQLAMANPQIAAMAMQAGLIDPAMMAQQQQQQAQEQSEAQPNQKQSQSGGGSNRGLSYADQIRSRVANAASPM